MREHPEKAPYRTQLALAYAQTARIQASADQLDEALRLFRESSIHLERLAAQSASNGIVRRRLGHIETDTTRILADVGRPAEALPHVQRALAILDRLATEAPAVASYRRSVAECYDVRGAAEVRMGRPEDALRSLTGARDTLDQLIADHPNFIAYQADCAENHLWTGAAYHDLGRAADALRELSSARELVERSPFGAENAYTLARTEARIAALTDAAERGAQTDRALAALRRAVAQGYRALDVLRTDPCLDPLRSRPDFQMLLLDLQFPTDPFRR